jgi:hypothetical protein
VIAQRDHVGLAPNHMGWVDEAWRDTTNLLDGTT